jgi:DNA repair exonuclease SbcCD ATPase subunit
MLKEYLKKVFNPASAEHQEEVTQMTEQLEQTTPAADNTAVAEMVAQLASQTEQLTTLQASFAELTTKYAEAEAALAASAEAQAALQAAAAAKVQATRAEQLTAIMGDVKGPTTAASLAALDDAAFDVVLASYTQNYEAEEKSEAFTEKGVAADAAPVVEADVAQRLAASFAAQFKS